MFGEYDIIFDDDMIDFTEEEMALAKHYESVEDAFDEYINEFNSKIATDTTISKRFKNKMLYGDVSIVSKVDGINVYQYGKEIYEVEPFSQWLKRKTRDDKLKDLGL